MLHNGATENERGGADMITITADLWGQRDDVTIDMPDDKRTERTLAAAIRTGKYGAGVGRSSGYAVTYRDLAQGYDAAAAGALVNRDKRAAAEYAAAAKRMRETSVIVGTIGSVRDAWRTAGPERSAVLTTSDLAETAEALGNRWSAKCIRLAADLEMDMSGQPTLFDAPDDANAPFGKRTRRPSRKIATSVRFDAPAVKRLTAKLPAVNVIAYGPVGTKAVDPSDLRDAYSSANAPWFVSAPAVATWSTPVTEAPAEAPVIPQEDTVTTVSDAPAEAAHAFTPGTENSHRCGVAGCNRGRAAKVHAAARAAQRAVIAERMAEAPAPAETVTEAPATVDQVDTAEAPARIDWTRVACIAQGVGFSADPRRPRECRLCGQIEALHPYSEGQATTDCACGQRVGLVGTDAPIIGSHTLADGGVCEHSGTAPAPAEVTTDGLTDFMREVTAEHGAPARTEVATFTRRMPAVDLVATEAPAIDVTGVDREALALVARGTWSLALVGKRGQREGVHVLSLPRDAGRLSRDAYLAVKAIAERIGGHWNREVRGFVFSKSQATFTNGRTVDGRETAEATLSALVDAVASADQGAPAAVTTEAPAATVAGMAEALRTAIRAAGAGNLSHVKTRTGTPVSSLITWCTPLVGRMPAGTVSTPSDLVDASTVVTCPACSHLVGCNRPGCVWCAAVLAEAPAPATVDQVDAPAERGPATLAEAEKFDDGRAAEWSKGNRVPLPAEAPADGRTGHVWCRSDLYAPRGLNAVTWCGEIGPELPAGHVGYSYGVGSGLVAVDASGPVRQTNGAAITCPVCSHRRTCHITDCEQCETGYAARRAAIEAATVPATVDQVDAPAPAEAIASVPTIDAPAEAPAPVTAQEDTVPTATVPVPVVPVPAEAPATVDQVAPATEAPAVSRVYDVRDRGEVHGYAFTVTGKVSRAVAKEIKSTLFAEREALGGKFWLIASERGTLGIVPASDDDAPADWAPALARVAELLATVPATV